MNKVIDTHIDQKHNDSSNASRSTLADLQPTICSKDPKSLNKS